MPDELQVAIAPEDTFEVADAVVASGGRLVDVAEAQLLIWSAPHDPQGLAEALTTSPADWVQVTSSGVENFAEAGLLDGSRTWTSAKGLYGTLCAEHVLALSLAAMRRLHVHARDVSGVAVGFEAPERQLRGRTVVIVGTGGIGANAARLFAAFGAQVIGVNRTGRTIEHANRVVTTGSLDEVLPEADLVVLCAPLTRQTRGMFDGARFRSMRPDSWLVNVSRGTLVDTDALTQAVQSGRIAGACLDVTDPEPLPADHPLRSLDTVLITPHIAATWGMSRDLFVQRVSDNVGRLARGDQPHGLVDQDAKY